jgi:hypothetical protein
MILSRRISLLLQGVLFLIPVNVYIIGGSLGAGMQWAFFRFQITYMGKNLITLSRDLEYFLNNIVTIRTGISTLLWISATLYLSLAFLLLLYRISNDDTDFKTSGLLTIGAGILFLLSSIMQYGPLFHGPAGFVIPVGIPVILITGWWLYHPSNEISGEVA